MVVLDTNILIEHLRRRGKDSPLLKLDKKFPKEDFALSIISIQELYEGKSTRNEKEEQYLLATITPLKILPYTFEVAKLAGEIARDLPRSLELADAVIASTAIINGCELATLNKKDFLGIKDLEVL